MSELKHKADDEIDLIQLIEILWNGKLFILIVTSLATIIGFAYAQFIKPTYVPNYKITEPHAYTLMFIRSKNATKLGNDGCSV
jgi:LPS O-antigen subunit length determinant protein (WzzB/FepE family)